MVLSTALFDRPPFLNCICHGVILDSTGQKLSKRLNNYADPIELFEKYGSDALRVTMLSSTVVKGQELLIDKEGKMVFDTLRLFIKPIWNSYHFFCLYANSDMLKAEISFDSKNVLDRYILSKLKLTISAIENSMDAFDSQTAYDAISRFFEVLNNWYIRRSRNRFWKTEKDQDKISAYNTLYTSLNLMTKAMSSLLPLISEHIYLGITGNDSNKDSVHLTDFPTLEVTVDTALVHVMDQVLDICSTALFIRSADNIRVRQPLASLKIITKNSESFKKFEDLIKDEINVKLITYSDDLLNYSDKKLSINFPILGKRLPTKMKDIIPLSKQGKWEHDGTKLMIAGEELLPEEYSLILEPRAARGAKSLSNNQGMISLDLEITKELEDEGIARDIIRLIQQARKEAEFNVSDRIYLELKSNLDLVSVLKEHGQLISEQTLSVFSQDFQADYKTQVPLLNQILEIAIKR
tara:strand:+ start:25 stop:1422 length:1398 start_codon:yes stop_codon:yes gene_type:complete